MNKSADNYFINGCGRCPLGGTNDCKVHKWTAELNLLRSIVNECNLKEECKWGVPCYTLNGKNVLIVSAFKEYCSLSFLKGSLIADEKNLLQKPGPDSQASRLFKFNNIEEILKNKDNIKAYIFQAVEIEKAGLNVEFKKNHGPLPEELVQKFNEDQVLKSAFEALTPGRQRSYILHFSQPKQSKTRLSRIEKCIPMILSGIGLNDKYKSRK